MIVIRMNFSEFNEIYWIKNCYNLNGQFETDCTKPAVKFNKTLNSKIVSSSVSFYYLNCWKTKDKLNFLHVQ